MSQTVIGIFEHTNQAQEAKSYLLANGFSNGDVDISTGGTATANGHTGMEGEEGFGDRIGNFLVIFLKMMMKLLPIPKLAAEEPL